MLVITWWCLGSHARGKARKVLHGSVSPDTAHLLSKGGRILVPGGSVLSQESHF